MIIANGFQRKKVMSNTKIQIQIPRPSDGKLGFLNTASYSEFILEGKNWPSVEHYMLAKQFEGSTLEEEIRTAKTISAARFLARPRSCIVQREGENAGVSKKVLYGRDLSLQKRDGWAREEKNYLKEAIFAKFDQNPKLKATLVQTDGIEIVSDPRQIKVGYQKHLGKLLMELRENIISAKATKKSKPPSWLKMTMPDTDITGPGVLTDDEKLFVSSILKILEWIRKIEKCPTVHPEMLEDVFYNILGPERFAVAEVWKDWNEERIGSWSRVVKDMPKYEKLSREITSLSTRVKFSDANHKLLSSIFISTVIRWVRMDAKNISVSIFDDAKNMKHTDIVLPPINRSYRNGVLTGLVKTPSSVSAQGTTTRKKKQVVGFPDTLASQNGHDALKVLEYPKETFDESLERGAVYVSIFSKYVSSILAGKKYSTLVGLLEKETSQNRDVWINTFKNSDDDARRNMILRMVQEQGK